MGRCRARQSACAKNARRRLLRIARRTCECPSAIPTVRLLTSRCSPTVPPTREDEEFVDGVAGILLSAILRTRAEDAIRHQATHDPLTGLPNRTLFNDRLEHALPSTRAGRRIRRGHGRRPRRLQERERQPRPPHRRRTPHRRRRPLRRTPAAISTRSHVSAVTSSRSWSTTSTLPTRPALSRNACSMHSSSRSQLRDRMRRDRSQHRHRARRPPRTAGRIGSSAMPTPRCIGRNEKERAATACSKPRCTRPPSTE